MTELQEQKIQWLSRAKSAQQKINVLQSLRKREERQFQEIQSFENSDDLVQRIRKLQLQTQHQMSSLISIQEEITRLIESIPDMQLQSILIRRYLIGETMEQIAEAMFYDVRTIQRKHKEALDALDIQVSLLTA